MKDCDGGLEKDVFCLSMTWRTSTLDDEQQQIHVTCSYSQDVLLLAVSRVLG